MFQPIMYFLLFFRMFTVMEKHLEKKKTYFRNRNFRNLEIYFILCYFKVRSQSDENSSKKEVIDNGNVTLAYQVHMLQIIFFT